MTGYQPKFFKESKKGSQLPVTFQIVGLPLYAQDITSQLEGRLTNMGYEVLGEGKVESDKKFIERTVDGHRQWRSTGLDIEHLNTLKGVELSIRSSERRRNEALKIVEDLEGFIAEAGKEKLEVSKKEDKETGQASPPLGIIEEISKEGVVIERKTVYNVRKEGILLFSLEETPDGKIETANVKRHEISPRQDTPEYFKVHEILTRRGVKIRVER